eukprot:3979269-Prymnesium_polylepis.1
MSSSLEALGAGSGSFSEAAQVRPSRTSEQRTPWCYPGVRRRHALERRCLRRHLSSCVRCALSLARVHVAADRPRRRDRARHRRRHHYMPYICLSFIFSALRLALRSAVLH